MLVLTREPTQSIMIGDDIEVSVVSVIGKKVRIGIRAPSEIPVFRTEIYLEIRGDGGVDLGAGGDAEPSDEQMRFEVDRALHELSGGSGGRDASAGG